VYSTSLFVGCDEYDQLDIDSGMLYFHWVFSCAANCHSCRMTVVFSWRRRYVEIHSPRSAMTRGIYCTGYRFKQPLHIKRGYWQWEKKRTQWYITYLHVKNCQRLSQSVYAAYVELLHDAQVALYAQLHHHQKTRIRASVPSLHWHDCMKYNQTINKNKHMLGIHFFRSQSIIVPLHVNTSLK